MLQIKNRQQSNYENEDVVTEGEESSTQDFNCGKETPRKCMYSLTMKTRPKKQPQKNKNR